MVIAHEGGWTFEIIADIAAALGLDEPAESTAILASLGAIRRSGASLGDDDLSHAPTFGTAVAT